MIRIVDTDSGVRYIGAADEETKCEDQWGEAGNQTQLDDSCTLQVKLLHQIPAQERTSSSSRDSGKTWREN